MNVSPCYRRRIASLLLFLLFTVASPHASGEAVGNPKPPALRLNGRLEQIGGGGSLLPIYKTIPGLKAGAGQIDKSVVQAPRTVASQVQKYSFPSSFNGNWGGRLAITYSKYSDMVPEERHQLSVGDEGLAIFSFVLDHSRMMLEPSKLWFRPRVARSIKNFAVLQGQQEQLAANPDAQVQVALLDLGGINTVDEQGKRVTYTVLKNTLSNLGQNVVEQNIVRQSNRVDPATGSSRQDFTEIVVRITRMRPDLMYAQIGYVQYGPSGEPLAQFISQGYITRNWLAAARGIEKMNDGKPLADLGYNADLSAAAAAAALPAAKDVARPSVKK